MATNLVRPDKDTNEGYEAELDTQNDGLAAAGFYPQYSTSFDQSVGIERNSTVEMVLFDREATVTLSQLLTNGLRSLVDLFGATFTSPELFFSYSLPDQNVILSLDSNTLYGQAFFDMFVGDTGTAVLFADFGVRLWNSNGFTWGVTDTSIGGVDRNIITLTADYVRSISAGTTNATGNQIVFSNSNGVSFGVSGATVTASFNPAAANFGGIAAGTQTATTGTVVFSNSNGVSFGLSGSSRVTASVDGIKSVSAGTTRITNNEIVFSDSNGLSFGINGQTVTASANYIRSISAGTTNATGNQIIFSNSNGVAFGVNGATVTASYSQSTAPSAIAAGTQTAASGTIVFSNSNGVAFGMSGSSQITASYSQSTAPAAVAAGTQTATSGTIVLSNSNGISFGMSGSTQVTASADYVRSISAGTTNATGNQIVFSNSSFISFGANAATVTADIAQPFSPKIIAANTTVPSNYVWLMHDFTINNGVNVFVADSGELYMH
jgi:hypothetical protein